MSENASRGLESPDTSNTDASTPRIAAELAALRDRVDDLETELDRKDDRIADLEAELDRKDDRIADLEAELDRLDTLKSRVETSKEAQTTMKARLNAHEKKLAANKERIAELQSRELEKGAHLRTDHVDIGTIEVPDDRLERITKDDGCRYVRVPESDDPLDRGGDVALAHGDLLPIQQLAKLDDDMLRSTTSALPTRLAAKLWKAQTDPTVGDDPWKSGSASVREYVTAGEMKHWIRRQESGISDSYAKKLVSRTIDALLELSKHRLAVRKRPQRKNGLEYTERRILIPADAEIPGETNGSGEPANDRAIETSTVSNTTPSGDS